MKCCYFRFVCFFLIPGFLLASQPARAWTSGLTPFDQNLSQRASQPDFLAFSVPWFEAQSIIEHQTNLNPFHTYFTAQDFAESDEDALASILLEDVKHELGATSDYVAFQQGILYQRTGNLLQASLAFEEASTSIRRDLRLRAQIAFVKSQIESKNKKAETLLTELLQEYPQLPEAHTLWTQLAEMYEAHGALTYALRIYRKVHLHFPGTFSDEKAILKSKKIQSMGLEVEPWSPEERAVQFINLVRSGFLNKAKQVQDQVPLAELSPDLKAQFHYRAAYIQLLEGDFRSAKKQFERAWKLIEQNEQTSLSQRFKKRVHEQMEDAWKAVVSKNKTIARKRIEKLRKRKSYNRLRTDKLVEIFEIVYQAKLKKAASKIQSALAKKKDLKSKSRLHVAIGLRQMGLFKQALKFLQPLKTNRKYKYAALFHEARVWEKTNLREQALIQYQELVSKKQKAPFYALLATQRLKHSQDFFQENIFQIQKSDSSRIIKSQTQKNDSLSEELAARLKPLVDAYGEVLPWLERAQIWTRLGEYKVASDELFEMYLAWREARERSIRNAGLWSIATGEQLPHFNFQEPEKKKIKSLAQEDLNTLAEIAMDLGDTGLAVFLGSQKTLNTFPRPYKNWVEKVAAKYSIDPNLIWAVMRIESVYQPRIVSHVGAIGLMQIMPRTGKLIAHELHAKDFTHDHLLDPKTNIEFAGWYLSSLLKRFDGNIPLAIAAYNGGPHNVKRWVDMHPVDTPLDIFVERIPFKQTRHYVRRVLAAYFEYREKQSLPLTLLSFDLSTYQSTDVLF